MGVKVQVSKKELYPPGEYQVVVTGNEVAQNGKIKVKFTIASGAYTGRVVPRNFNPNISENSDLGKLMVVCGVQIASAQAGTSLDLDVINGAPLIAALTHFNLPTGGTINSLSNFRADPSRQRVAVAPAQAYQPAPQYAPPAQAIGAAQVGAYTPPPNPAPAAPAAQPTLGPKISF